MFNIDYCPSVHPIVMEASSAEDKKFMKSMSKQDVHQVNGALIQNLYSSVIKRKDIDFGDIPNSDGDIEKVKFYKSTVESLDTLEELYRKNNIDEPSVSEVKRAISNMKKFKPQFTTGFRMKHEFMMITYNSLVMSIIDATSLLISSYVTYVVSADDMYHLTHEVDKNRGYVALENIRKFNVASENGNMVNALSYMTDEGRKAFMGEDIILTGAIIMCLLSIVPLIREIVYFYYSRRVKLADYLNMQADFLEMNKLAVEASKKSPAEKKAIVKKQETVIKRMRKTADKLVIDNVDTNDVVKKELKDDNSLWSLQTIEKQLSNSKLNGVSLNIV